MRVILRNNQDPDDGRVYWSLTVGREYEVVSISADHYRIVDDTGDPYIFEPACFEVVDDNEPAFWKVSFGEGGDRYANPPEWSEPGFFEDYHDRIESVRKQFWEDHVRYYGEPRPPTKSRDHWRSYFDSQ
ncbi:MAG: hypothetical protein R3E58_16605 [Phycisphaerae bacterium]